MESFQPDFSPPEMFALGIFGGAYFSSPRDHADLPADWFPADKLSYGKPDKNINLYKTFAGLPKEEWQKWMHEQDPLGWYQWYCRWYLGRRTDDDHRQQARWFSFKARHLAGLIKKSTPRRAQALVQWGIDPRKFITAK